MTANHDDGARSLCGECGHVHAGPELGGICIGCACDRRPPAPAPRSGRARRLPAIPLTLLPAPRLIVWTGDPGEDPATAGALAVISRTYHAVIDHGWAASGITAGGNDWSGWHLPDAAHVDGLVDLVLAIAPRHWTVER